MPPCCSCSGSQAPKASGAELAPAVPGRNKIRKEKMSGEREERRPQRPDAHHSANVTLMLVVHGGVLETPLPRLEPPDLGGGRKAI